jgi:ubiquinone/menaquinone biosynthesis C-methylase UbiE
MEAAMPHLGHRAAESGAFRHPGPYDRLAHRWLRRLYLRVADDVAGAGLPDGARVLDVGTGPGRVPLAIAEAAPGLDVEGIDLSPEMIEHARGLVAGQHVTFTVGDVANLPYPDGSFDLIVSTLSQHHWANVDGGVRELLRVTKPGGQIWIYDVRFALRRARAAARSHCPTCRVARETVRTGPLSLGLIARLSLSRPLR